MKKVFGFGAGFLLFFCMTAWAGEAVSPAVQETLVQDTEVQKRLKEGIGIGPGKQWRVSPAFKFATIYDSNINREPSGQRDESVIFNIIPSVSLTRVGSKYGVLADYEMNYQAYTKDSSQQNGFNNRISDTMWYTGEKLTAKVYEGFGYMKTYATSEQSQRRTFVYNDANPEIIYNLTPKVSVSSIYRNYFFHYTDSILKPFSYDQNDIGGRAYYHMTPKTDLFVEGQGNLTDYYESGLFDSHGFGVYAGAVGRPTQKVVLNLKTGFQGREYESNRINDFYNWVGELGLRYSLTSKIDATLIAKRGIEESVYQNVGYYTFNQIYLSFQYRLTSKFALQAGGHYQNNRYPSEILEGTTLKKRHDSIVIVDPKLTWEPIDDLKFGVGYTYSTRVSNFSPFQYVDHMVEASASYKF